MPNTDLEFNTPAGQTIDRGLMVLCLNTGTDAAPVWSPVGSGVESSDMEFDWNKNTVTDILGIVRTTMRKPQITQSFDPFPLHSGDAAAEKLWNLGIKEQNAQALANLDMLVAHLYVGTGWGERYSSCSADVNRIGGDGGGNITIGSEVTFGGTRTLGTVTKGTNGTLVFTEDTTA